MDTITLGQIGTVLAWLAGFCGSVGAVYGIVNKIFSKKIDTEIENKLGPVLDSLEEIKQQNHELKEQGEDTKREMILMMKLNQTMVDELKTLGHVNGATAAALNELNDYLINK